MAINLRGRAEEGSGQILKQLKFQDCLDDLKRVIRTFSRPPVLVAHSLGGLLAQELAKVERVSATVLISSVPTAGLEKDTTYELRMLRLKYMPLVFLRRPFSLTEKDFSRSFLPSWPRYRHAELLKLMVPESGYLVNEFLWRRIRVDLERISCPVLVVGGEEDRMVPLTSLREMARQLGADLKEYPNHAHWLIGESEEEMIVGDIHRWLVQKLGEENLVADFSGGPGEGMEV